MQPRHPSSSRSQVFRDRRRGSVLVVAILLGTGIALSLGSFIVLTVDSFKLSNRSYYANSTLNLAEAGLEMAILAMNHSDWSGWSTHSSGSQNKVRNIPNLDLGQGTDGEITVVVYGYSSAPNPRVVAEGRATPTIGPAITKQIEVRLHRRSHFATGLVAKDSITFSGGNATVDSYVSDDPSFSTSGLYDPAKRRDKGSAGSISVTTDAIAISNSDIWGYVATGGSQPQAGPNGTILGTDSPPGIKIDPNRIATDFSANFAPVTPPTSFDYIYGNVSGDETFGTAGTTTTIKLANYDNSNGRTLNIVGDVVLVVTDSVDLKGELVVAAHSSLTVYVAGDFDAGGNGIVNATGLPESLIIYGTATTEGAQTIKLHGNAELHAAVYAPNAHIEMKGGGSDGEMSGSVIGYDIKITGNYAFHYDEALADLGGGNPFAVGKWRELVTAAERETL